MFSFSQFNGDISEIGMFRKLKIWFMFEKSQFTGDISNWDVLRLKI